MSKHIERHTIVKMAVLLSCVVAMSGCTLIPDLNPFGGTVPQSYPQGPAYDDALTQEEARAQDNLLHAVSWRRYYRDDTLKGLIETGLANNSDLKIAAFRITEARALYDIEKSALIPDAIAEGTYVREKSNRSDIPGGAQNFIYQDYEVSLGFTAYELDFFGRLRSLKQAALNEYLATRWAHQAVRISLIADIATAYTSLRANQALLALARDTLETRQKSFDLIQKRARAGVATDLELAQAETLLLRTRVDVSESVDAVARDKNALRLLLGTPDRLPSLARSDKDRTIGDIMPGVPVGLPSKLLTTRPDILEAEYRLYSANADIGAARAAFFPRISLTTTGGYSSAEFSGLFDSVSQVWRFSPQIAVPIFTAGRLKNNLDLAAVRKEIAVVEYEKAIETAFRDVSDALSAVSTFDDRVSAQKNLVKAAARRTSLSQERYEAGVENYLAVLDSKRELYAARQDLIRQKAQELSAKIALYKAVGGGM